MVPINPDDLWRGLTTVAGSWIGGGANQTAMKEMFNVDDQIFSSMITVDVIVANVWTRDLKIQFIENEYPQYIDSLAILNDCSLLLEYSKSRETVDINTKLLEDSINDIDYVYNAEVYLRDGNLNILIEYTTWWIYQAVCASVLVELAR